MKEFTEWEYLDKPFYHKESKQTVIAQRFNVWTGDPQYIVQGDLPLMNINGCLVFEED